MKLNFLIAAGLVLMAGCNQQPTPAAPASPGEAATTPSPTPTAATPTATGADFKLDQAIPAENIKTGLALVGNPVYRAKDDMLLFDVEVTNSGKSPLTSIGKAPVLLAINVAGPEGVDTPPGKRLVSRASLPLIAEGSKGVVKAQVLAESVLGQTVRVELFQEGIGWFGRRYNQPTLDVGKFERCKGAAGTLCDGSGTAVATPSQ